MKSLIRPLNKNNEYNGKKITVNKTESCLSGYYIENYFKNHQFPNYFMQTAKRKVYKIYNCVKYDDINSSNNNSNENKFGTTDIY